MTRWLYFVVVAAFVGCSNSSPDKKSESDSKPVAQKSPSAKEELPNKQPPETKAAPPKTKEPKSTVKNAQEARDELQSRIDRCLGGQPVEKVLIGIGIWAVGKKVTSIDIVCVVQKYDKEGNAVANEFVAVIRCVGEDNISGRRETREFESILFGFRKKEWTFAF